MYDDYFSSVTEAAFRNELEKIAVSLAPNPKGARGLAWKMWSAVSPSAKRAKHVISEAERLGPQYEDAISLQMAGGRRPMNLSRPGGLPTASDKSLEVSDQYRRQLSSGTGIGNWLNQKLAPSPTRVRLNTEQHLDDVIGNFDRPQWRATQNKLRANKNKRIADESRFNQMVHEARNPQAAELLRREAQARRIPWSDNSNRGAFF